MTRSMQLCAWSRFNPPISHLALGIAVFLLPCLSACSPDRPGDRASDRTQTTPPAAAGETYDTLIIGDWADERLFGPYWGSLARDMIFEPLFRETYRAGEFTPALVTRWEPSDDFRTWTYTIRSDVRWQDGVPLTAEDVKFTFDLSADPEVFNYPPGSVTARVLNDTTVQVTYRDPVNPTPPLSIWPRHLLQDLDPKEFWDWDFWIEPVGSGPYRYVRHLDKELMEVEANPDYFRGPPAIEKVIFKFGGVGLVELRAGNVDALSAPAFADPLLMAPDPDFQVYFNNEWFASTVAIYWNHRNPLFRDVAVRRALTMAIDREELGRVLNLPPGSRIVDAVVPGHPGGVDPGEAWPYDPAEARRLLAEAGWVDEDGDGILERDGQEFRFTVVVSGARGDWNTEGDAIYVQAKLAELGVKMEIQPLEGARMVRNATESGEADATIQRFHFGNLEQILAEDSYIGYDDPELRGLVEASVAKFDPETRRGLVNEALALFRERLPVTILHPFFQYSVAHRRVKGLRSPDRADPVAWVQELWIENEPGTAGGSGG